MDPDLVEALENIRVVNHELRRVAVDHRLHLRARHECHEREVSLRGRRDALVLGLLENLSEPITQAEIARYLGLSRERIRQIVDRARRTLAGQEESP